MVSDVCDVRKTRTQYMSVSGHRIQMSWRRHARKGSMNLLRIQQFCLLLRKVLTLLDSWLSNCHSFTRLLLRSLLKGSSTHSIQRTKQLRKNGQGLKVWSSRSSSESSKRRMLWKRQRKKRSSSLRERRSEVVANRSKRWRVCWKGWYRTRGLRT